MGCDSSHDSCTPEEQSLHAVTLDAYAIDSYEVTNTRYASCVEAGSCTVPHSTLSNTRAEYYGNAAYVNYPVVHADWNQAAAFCAWDGKRLPTEAEREKAARGGDDTRSYPWGNDAPTCSQANLSRDSLGTHCDVLDMTAVGIYPAGASPYGAMDMTGNVEEWVSDWYELGCYSVSRPISPQGPATGTLRVLRGGGWYYGYLGYVRASARDSNDPDGWGRGGGLGFRCVRPQ
jgi:serine/threonine-protein kinase